MCDPKSFVYDDRGEERSCYFANCHVGGTITNECRYKCPDFVKCVESSDRDLVVIVTVCCFVALLTIVGVVCLLVWVRLRRRRRKELPLPAGMEERSPLPVTHPAEETHYLSPLPVTHPAEETQYLSPPPVTHPTEETQYLSDFSNSEFVTSRTTPL